MVFSIEDRCLKLASYFAFSLAARQFGSRSRRNRAACGRRKRNTENERCYIERLYKIDMLIIKLDHSTLPTDNGTVD